ncbi:MAG: hypothetical protein WBP12_01790 [Candidatus Saccharimonas sp.]
MSDSIFISTGLINASGSIASLNRDRAIANTIAHEIGHNLCLTSTQLYNEQPSQCVYAGIDNNGDEEEGDNLDYYNLANYESVMNYLYQLTDDQDLGYVDYSDGSNTTDDHDDWNAVSIGLGKFNIERTYYTEFGARSSQANTFDLDPDGNVIID